MVLRRFQHCTGHITTGSWKGRGNQYIEFARVVYCKLPTNGKQLPAFPLKAVTGIEPPTSEVGGESVTTLPPWPLVSDVNVSNSSSQFPMPQWSHVRAVFKIPSIKDLIFDVNNKVVSADLIETSSQQVSGRMSCPAMTLNYQNVNNGSNEFNFRCRDTYWCNRESYIMGQWRIVLNDSNSLILF